MGVYTDKFLNNYSASGGRYAYRPSFDIGAELSNFSSVALTEASNYMTLMESTFDPQEQRILEAKLDVLYEVSIKDIGAKIKSFFKWIKDQVKKFFAWVKGLFKKTKSAETKSNTKKADDAAKKIPPAQSPTQGADKAKQEATKAAEEAVKHNESVGAAVQKAVEKNMDNISLAKNKKALMFVKKITSIPLLYLDVDAIINPGFVGATNAELAKMKRQINSVSNTGGLGNDTSNSTANINKDIMAIKWDFIEKSKTVGATDIIKDSGQGAVLNVASLNKGIDYHCVVNMHETLTSLNIDDLSTYTKWLDNKAALVANRDIKTMEVLIKNLDQQVNQAEKATDEIISLVNNKSVEKKDGRVFNLPVAFALITCMLTINRNIINAIAPKLQGQLTALNNVSKTVLGIIKGNTDDSLAQDEKF